MTNSNAVLLYVSDMASSVRFYSFLLESNPVEESPGFTLFILPSGLALGLWNKAGVLPTPTVSGGGSELGFKLDTLERIDSTFLQWKDRGVDIILEPTNLGFGRSFVACDPDGHRLRVYALFPQ